MPNSNRSGPSSTAARRPSTPTPTSANCCVDLVRGIDESLIEFGADTARAIFTVVFGGVAAKYPDINWIWSHGGGVLPSLAERILDRASRLPPTEIKFTHEQVNAQLRRFYYDTAMIMNEAPIAALVKLVPMSQIVYGTDYPYRTSVDYTKTLPALFSGDDLKAVERDNALRLIPRLKAA
jgi:predicted TIM-barrel fold metal-dependent hydrolase